MHDTFHFLELGLIMLQAASLQMLAYKPFVNCLNYN